MLPWKIFENLHAVMAILMLLEQFLGKFYIFAPNSKCFTKYDAFCLHIFDYAYLSAYLQTWRLKLSHTKTVTTAFHLNNREAKRELKIFNNGKL